MVLGTWAFITILDIVREGESQRFDNRVIEWCWHHKGPPWLQDCARDVTALGGFSLLAQVTKERVLKLYFISVALALTFLVGISRVYLRVHWPTDVLAGWTAGLAWAILCLLIAHQLQRRGAVEQ